MLSFPLGRDRAPVPASLQAVDFTVGGPHPRENELDCHSSVLAGPDSSLGVVTQPRGHKTHVPPMEPSSCWPVAIRWKVKLPTFVSPVTVPVQLPGLVVNALSLR